MKNWKKHSSLPQSGLWHFLQMNPRLHMRKELTLGPSPRAGIIAHEVQMPYHLPWNVTTVHDGDGCICWCCHDELDGKESLGISNISFGSLEGLIWTQSFSTVASETSFYFFRKVHAEDPVHVDVAGVGAFETHLTAPSATKAWLRSPSYTPD